MTNLPKRTRAKRPLSPDTKKAKWCYKKADPNLTIFGKLTPRLMLVDLKTGVTWTYIPQCWEERVVRSDDPNACWDWRGSFHRQHIGLFNVHRFNEPKAKSGQMAIQRFSMALSLDRPLAADERVMNTCHNDACCNPAHLKIGTRRETFANSECTRGKKLFESKYPQEYLEKNKVLYRNLTVKELAALLGLSNNAASYLKALVKNRTSLDSKIEVIDLRTRKKRTTTNV